MAIIRRSFTFMAGTLTGAYIAQNYNVPSGQQIVQGWFCGGQACGGDLQETQQSQSRKTILKNEHMYQQLYINPLPKKKKLCKYSGIWHV
ncbi:hypothetical protein PHJA_001935200 [Phtheirospermum japonicum]|uniref:Uncharacterized protein n=1 Tax=Phtheirospermum japonicum TaxID=374723 RepID=A0A830CUA0_9LAMI|nr:hypothetical protein PHJA_001935200 [Phtheirospermum japonicum]